MTLSTDSDWGAAGVRQIGKDFHQFYGADRGIDLHACDVELRRGTG